jgi:hypothetical protein
MKRLYLLVFFWVYCVTSVRSQYTFNVDLKINDVQVNFKNGDLTLFVINRESTEKKVHVYQYLNNGFIIPDSSLNSNLIIIKYRNNYIHHYVNLSSLNVNKALFECRIYYKYKIYLKYKHTPISNCVKPQEINTISIIPAIIPENIGTLIDPSCISYCIPNRRKYRTELESIIR